MRRACFSPSRGRCGRCCRLIERSGPSHANVLITGEAGTGKSVVARALHEASPRSDRPLFSIVGGGRPDDALEVELFGAAALPSGDGVSSGPASTSWPTGGTLLIDEAANLPASLQGRLLEALESGTFFRNGSSGQARRADVRILAATSADAAGRGGGGPIQPGAAAAARHDRNRAAAAARAARGHSARWPSVFSEEFAELHGSLVKDFDDAAMAALVRHRWPGNVRELRHAVECAVRVARRPVLTCAISACASGENGRPAWTT